MQKVTAPPFNPADEAPFNTRYIKSRIPAIQELFVGTCGQPGVPMDLTTRLAACNALAKAGTVVDPQIDTGILEPYFVNQHALQGGFMTRPKIGETVPFCTPPGISMPGVPNYDDFTFAIKSSLADADYPAFSGPIPPVTLYVGARANNEGMYNVINGAEKVFKLGEQHYEQNHYFTFGPVAAGVYYWTIVQE